MAKRFTDTDKWRKPWFRQLNGRAKMVWIYLTDNCDHAGFWPAAFDLISLDVGFEVSAGDLERWFGEKVELFGDKYFINSFIEFQYGKLSQESRVHKSVLDRLEKERVSKGFANPMDRIKDKDKDKDIDIDSCFEIEEAPQQDSETSKEPDVSPRVLVEIWNSDRGPFSAVEKLTDQRKDKARTQLRKYPDLQHWRSVLNRWKSSEFCTGTWKPTFDDWLSESKRIATLEGKYDNRKAPNSNKNAAPLIRYPDARVILSEINRSQSERSGGVEAAAKVRDLIAQTLNYKPDDKAGA